MSKIKYYRKKAIQPMIPWEPGMDVDDVSISLADAQAGSPKEGDMIAFNPNDETDRWLVAADYVAANYEEVEAPE